MSRLETSQSDHPLGMAPSVGKGRGQGGLGADRSPHRQPGEGQKGHRAEGDGADRIQQNGYGRGDRMRRHRKGERKEEEEEGRDVQKRRLMNGRGVRN